jgi:hypothetical protein
MQFSDEVDPLWDMAAGLAGQEDQWKYASNHPARGAVFPAR